MFTAVLAACALTLSAATPMLPDAGSYQPAESNLQARQAFSERRFGIFLHWGIYSMFGQGEWYMNNAGINRNEYAKAAQGFFPSRFDASSWVTAFREAGAKYICFTTRHHDGFSMYATKQSDYNIVDGTPFHRDVLRELVDECRRQGLAVHFYYSHLDWMREDYPLGNTGGRSGRDRSKANWSSYFSFMNNQLTELVKNYDPDAIWFDGMWDHNNDATPFDWHLSEQYALLHSLKPGLLVGNNHHDKPYPGEDMQFFERDLPGENKAGMSGQAVSALPLETCETMNANWGYSVQDQKYKSVDQLVRLLVGAAGKGANLLLNIGPMPNGELPSLSLDRLRGMGQWLEKNGETIYGTVAGDVPTRPWGVTTRKGDRLFVHILSYTDSSLFLPVKAKVRKAIDFESKESLRFSQSEDGVLIHLGKVPQGVDHIVELQTK
ncbi:MAG: alpha-L-fucosidase [Bacteroidaceae bacterium]